MKPKVYLAGPITGLTYGESTDWREAIHRALQPEIDTLSPMRAKAYLKTLPADLIGDEYSDRILSTQKAITARDRYDTQRADLVIFNFLGATKGSLGTAIELGWADAARVPGILVIEDSGNVHDHSMVRETTGWRVNNLEDAVKTARAILLPDA
jgi:nucleoside 2-deoxyribosyltransferase